MVYVALLRGINVGGNNIIDMKLLKETFIKKGMESVRTYINSGNVIFSDAIHTQTEIATLLQEAIYEDFKLDVRVLIRSLDEFNQIMKVLPDSWVNDKNNKCDVLFLWDEVETDMVIEKLTIKPSIDTVIYSPGTILWKVDKSNVTKSGLMKLASLPLYKKMTVRNVNTTRKIFEIMNTL